MTFRRALYMLAGISLAFLIGGVYYAVAVQPDPSVRMIPMSYQTERTARPILNIGIDAKGLTLDQFVAGGGKSQDYRPVEATTIKAGQHMFVLRYLEFRNKLAEPMIHRSLLCGKVSRDAKTGAPIVDVDGMVPYNLGSIPAPTRTDGAAVKNHPTLIPLWVMRDSEGKPLTAPRTCVYRASAKFIKNPVQAIDLNFAAVAVTVAPESSQPGAAGGR